MTSTPCLSIRQAGFAPDFIWAGLYFASARLRAAIGLGADAVEYRDVEMDDRSCEAALAADSLIGKASDMESASSADTP